MSQQLPYGQPAGQPAGPPQPPGGHAPWPAQPPYNPSQPPYLQQPPQYQMPYAPQYREPYSPSPNSRPLVVVHTSLAYAFMNPVHWLVWFGTLGVGFIFWLIWWSRNQLVVYPDRIVRKSGLITKHERSIPIWSVQDITIRSQLGFQQIVIETAGGSSLEQFGWIRGGYAVRDVIYKEIGGSRGAPW